MLKLFVLLAIALSAQGLLEPEPVAEPDSGAAPDSANDINEIPDDGDDDDDDGDESGEDYWMPPDADRKCRPGQGFSDNECGDCPEGTYNFPGSRVDSCFKCPLGHFTSSTGQTECLKCGSITDGPSTTKQIGSNSIEQCIDPDEIVTNFAKATVGLRVEVGGGDFCTGMKKLLREVSQIIFYDGHIIECTYDESEDLTKMIFEITPPAKYAWSIWEVINFVHTHLDMINAYIPLGDFYATQFLEYLNVMSQNELGFLGIHFNTEMLTIDKFSVVTFEPYFEGHCPYNAAVEDIYCEKGDDSYSSYNYYLALRVSGIDCSTNAGQTKIRNIIETDPAMPPTCLDDKSCELKFVSCSIDEQSNQNLVAVQVAATASTATFNADSFPIDFKFTAGDGDVIITVAGVESGCAVDRGAELELEATAGTTTFSVKCDSCTEGQFVNGKGMCEICPFTTWGSDGVHCNSCGWVYETPFWGMNDEGQCIQPTNWWEVVDDYEDYLKEPAGVLRFQLNVTPTMDMCGVSHAKKAIDETCGNLFADLKFTDAADFGTLFEEGWQLEHLICRISSNFVFGYGMLCEPEGAVWDKPWDDIFSRLLEEGTDALLDVACYVGKRVKHLEEVDTSDNCEALDSTLHIMNMDIEFGAYIDIYLSGIIVPLLTRLKHLETMNNFGSVSDAGMTIIENLGVADVNAFIGWEIANVLLDAVMAVPKGLSISEYTFVALYEKSSFFCDNDKVKRKCDRHLECNMDNCRILEQDGEVELTCAFDECENCAVSYMFFNGDTQTEQEYSCASCSFPQSIENAKLKDVLDNKVEALYVCNEGFVSSECNPVAYCDYNNGDIKYPNCVEDKCEYPEIENGKIYQDWRSEENYYSCPYAKYRCNDGLMLSDQGKATCHVDNDYHIEATFTCIERCEFPAEIENGQLVEEYQIGDDYYAEYRCKEGFYHRHSDRGSCDREWDEQYEKVVAAMVLPECEPEGDDDDWSDGDGDGSGGDGTCQFPDYIPKGYLVWQGDEGNSHYAYYICYPPFVNTPNEDMMKGTLESDISVSEAYMNVYGLAVCHRGIVYFPECMDPEEAGHCGLPTHIHNGKAVEFMWKEAEEDGDGAGDERYEKKDDVMPMMAKYQCDEDYVMHQTVKGDIGWCRMDGSMEIPRCEHRDSYMDIKFKLYNGAMNKLEKDGTVFGGIVLAMSVDADGTQTSEYEYGCNDGGNDYAAGAICRNIGFGNGAQIPVSKKMMVTGEGHKFGWTKISCKYDDTLVTSQNCEATRYEEAIEKMGVKAACFDFDIFAVKCFEHTFKVDVTMKFSKKKMTCNAQVLKEDNRIDLENMGLDVKFMLDGTEIETGEVKYKVRKGFFTKVDLRQKDFDCASCEIYAGDTLMGKGEKCKD